MTRLRDLCQVNPGVPQWDRLDDHDLVPFLPMERVWTDRLDLSEVRPKHEVASGYTRFAEGDLLLPKITPTFEAGRAAVAIGLTGGIGTGTTELHVLRPSHHVNPRWLLHFLNSETFLRCGHADMYGVAGQKRISADFVKSYPVDPPALEDQQRIADYLDAETAHLDELVAEQETLIGYLTERRTAELDGWIEHGGAESALRPVDSPWLDAVPQDWALMPLKHAVARVMVGIVITPSAYYEETGVPVLRGLNVKPGHVIPDDLVYMSDHSNRLHAKSILRRGDVVVVRTGLAGSAAQVPEWAVGGNAVDLLIVRPGRKLVPAFVELLLNSRLVQRQVVHGSVGALQAHFNTSSLSNVSVTVPPLVEQTRVVNHMTAILGSYDELVSEAENQIALLRERRQALITHAVTHGLEGLSGVA